MKLANCSGFKSPALAINIAKINKALLEESKTADEVFQKLVKQYCKKDEAGEIVPHDGRPGTFVIDDAKVKEWDEKLKEFHSISFDVDRPKILLLDVQTAAPLSPLEIMALDKILLYEDEAKPGLKAVKD